MQKHVASVAPAVWSGVLCALNGIAVLIASQRNARIHAAATAVVIALGIYFGLTRPDWCWIIAAITAVWAAEAFNTAVETLTDLVSPNHHTLAGSTKDLAAGAVLLVAMGAAAIGIVVFVPHIAALI